MELYIETLTGAAFELRVSPFETIMSVKAKIQRIEGIPIAQQHLIWKSVELEDDYCLHDYSIHDGATLKLVLAMRGGPINTRRIPMEDPALREMVEYVEANREDIWEKLPGNRQVTLLVFREGDQLNFFRVVDRGDGTLTPLSESLRYDNDDPALTTDFNGASMYNFNDEEEEEDAPTKEKVEENEQLKEKMKQIRSKMDKLNISKKPQRKPHPPSSGRANSRSSRLRHLPSTSYSLGPTLNRNLCLPPVGGHAIGGGMSHSLALQHSLLKERIERLDREEEKERTGGASFSSTLHSSVAATDKLADVHSGYAVGGSVGTSDLSEAAAHQLDSIEKLSQALSSVIEDSEKLDIAEGVHDPASRLTSNSDKHHLNEKRLSASKDRSELHVGKADLNEGNSDGKVLSTNCDAGGSGYEPGTSSHKRDVRLSSLTGDTKPASASRPVTSSKIKDMTLESLRSTSSSKGKSKLKASEYSLLDSLRETIGAASSMSRHSSLEKRKEFTLESLSTSEARAMSGLLRQASLEKVGSSRIGNVTVTSASRNRLTGNYTLGNSSFPDGRITTPEGRLVSARLQRITTSRDGRLLSPSHRLPPVKSKKKASKRCFVCAKKTGLACSYTCRCGNNFCATHRYAESHDCTFDYKTEGRKLLEQNNPVVSAPKLPKI